MITIYFGKLAKAEATVFPFGDEWTGKLILKNEEGAEAKIFTGDFKHKVEAINALFEAAEKIAQSVRILADESNMGDFRDSIELVNEKLAANGAEALQE